MEKRQIFFSNEYVHKFFKSIENYTIKCRIIKYLIKKSEKTTNLCLHHDKRKIININNIENNLNVGIDESCNIINISNCNIDYI